MGVMIGHERAAGAGQLRLWAFNSCALKRLPSRGRLWIMIRLCNTALRLGTRVRMVFAT